MKTLTVKIPDHLYERTERRAAARGATLDQEVTEILEKCTSAEETTSLAAARAQMENLFRIVRGFRMGAKIPREELYDRGRIR